LEKLQFKPDLVLSNRHEARVPIRWIAILRDILPSLSLAATSGVHRKEGVIKLLLAGADVTMMASVLLINGPAFLGQLLADVGTWLEENEYDSVEQLKGSMSKANCPDPSALERANYMKTLTTYTWQRPLPEAPL
jgi:dihydroorotate dehydrogenase (fumarate)